MTEEGLAVARRLAFETRRALDAEIAALGGAPARDV